MTVQKWLDPYMEGISRREIAVAMSGSDKGVSSMERNLRNWNSCRKRTTLLPDGQYSLIVKAINGINGGESAINTDTLKAAHLEFLKDCGHVLNDKGLLDWFDQHGQSDLAKHILSNLGVTDTKRAVNEITRRIKEDKYDALSKYIGPKFLNGPIHNAKRDEELVSIRDFVAQIVLLYVKPNPDFQDSNGCLETAKGVTNPATIRLQLDTSRGGKLTNLRAENKLRIDTDSLRAVDCGVTESVNEFQRTEEIAKSLQAHIGDLNNRKRIVRFVKKLQEQTDHIDSKVALTAETISDDQKYFEALDIWFAVTNGDVYGDIFAYATDQEPEEVLNLLSDKFSHLRLFDLSRSPGPDEAGTLDVLHCGNEEKLLIWLANYLHQIDEHPSKKSNNTNLIGEQAMSKNPTTNVTQHFHDRVGSNNLPIGDSSVINQGTVISEGKEAWAALRQGLELLDQHPLDNPELAAQLRAIDQAVDKKELLPAESRNWIEKGGEWAKGMGDSIKYSGQLADAMTKVSKFIEQMGVGNGPA